MRLLKKKKFNPLVTDLHSHLIPHIDDGAESLQSSIAMLKGLRRLGFQNVVTTPHIHPKYPNKPEGIMDGLQQVREAVKSNQLDINLEAAAEYFVDEHFLDRLQADEKLLSFGEKYVLIECSFINKPLFLENAILRIKASGYNPVFAHPERYQFLQGDLAWLVQIRKSGVLFQVTLSSLAGYYGKMARKMGEMLIKNDLVDFLATDLHRPDQLDWVHKSLKMSSVQKLIANGRLLNDTLQ